MCSLSDLYILKNIYQKIQKFNFNIPCNFGKYTLKKDFYAIRLFVIICSRTAQREELMSLIGLKREFHERTIPFRRVRKG